MHAATLQFFERRPMGAGVGMSMGPGELRVALFCICSHTLE